MNAVEQILAQLGGNRFIASVGAKNLAHSGDTTLSFSLPRQARFKVKHVKIEITPNDTYSLTFYSVKGFDYTEVTQVQDVYACELLNVFSSVTGLLVI